MSGNQVHLLIAHPLGLIVAVLVTLQNVVGALHDGLAVTLHAIGLGAEMPPDHVIDAGHFFEDAGSLFLERGKGHRNVWRILYSYHTTIRQEAKGNKRFFTSSD